MRMGQRIKPTKQIYKDSGYSIKCKRLKCNRKARTRGFCNRCYQNFKKGKFGINGL